MSYSKNNINPASFLSLIEEARANQKINQNEYKVLLNDMSTILDNMGDSYGDQLILGKPNLIMTIRTRDYAREYVDGKIYQESWFKNGELHREKNDEPSVIRYFSASGCIETCYWHLYGEESRANGKPTQVSYYNHSGKLKVEQWPNIESQLCSEFISIVKLPLNRVVVFESFSKNC